MILHFLKDLIPFLDSCEQIGLNPTESILFYKEYRYPLKEAIMEYLKPKGYPIYSLEYIDTELQKIKERWDVNKKPIIVVEDGGYVVPRGHASFKGLGKQIIGAVEQTTKGEKSDKKIKKLTFPVVSVAGSQLKSSFEPPHVARAVINNIQRVLSQVNFSSQHALLLGYGVIGKEIAKQLKDTLKMNVTVFDLDSVRRVEARQQGFDTKDSCAEAVKDQFLIIGATGETSIGKKEILAMNHNVYLVSASSDQREIGLRELEALKSKKEDTIENNKKIGSRYEIRGQAKSINLIADGYPINFWAEESMPNQVSDLIMSLIFLSTIDIAKNYKSLEKEVKSDRVNEIAEDYKVADSYLNYYHSR
jgi:adenosylhomocysteinase